MIDRIPAELTFLSVYFPPFFFTVVVGLGCALLAAKILNVTGGSRFFWHPQLAFLALWVLAAVLFLPGLPITIAGGLLFGAVCGALAFLGVRRGLSA